MEAFEKVDLPSGAWAALRDPEQTTEKQRRPVARLRNRIGLERDLRAVLEAQRRGPDEPVPDGPVPQQAALTDAQLDLLSDYMEATIVALVESWSFEQPVTVEGLQSIPGAKDYEALALACRKHQDAMFPSFEPDPDPESPTPASDD